MNGKRTTTIVILAVYAVAMAMVEAVAVVYLRELYYPGGFSVASAADLAVIPAHILRVEFWREAATMPWRLWRFPDGGSAFLPFSGRSRFGTSGIIFSFISFCAGRPRSARLTSIS
ncbi:MAG: hypothetical protein HYT14_00670 [Candidatus Liptonbacteria bacterium]|nr:hypothetical protein [Candidatus Liptonbacteria bacterium]